MQTYTNDDRVGYYTVLDNKLVHTYGRNALPPRSGKFLWLMWLTHQITKAGATLEGLHLVPISIISSPSTSRVMTSFGSTN
jgi:hypothetical protein